MAIATRARYDLPLRVGGGSCRVYVHYIQIRGAPGSLLCDIEY